MDEENYTMWWSWQQKTKDTAETLKSERLAIARILLEAGADGRARFSHAERPSWGKDKKSDPERPEDISSLARSNPNSGGPEVVELVSRVQAQPRRLQSSCRLAIRRHLPRPILLAGNVEKLPLPEKVKSYIAMETMQMAA